MRQRNRATVRGEAIDGEVVWPAPDSPSRIRALDSARALRLAFGSCRYVRAEAVVGDTKFDADALDAPDPVA
jgi:hypothetical protein